MQRVFVKGIKGGTGCTSVVANLACVLKKSAENVVVIDLDSKSDLSLHFGLPWSNTRGWSNATTFNHVLSMFYQDSDGVIFLPFGDNLAMQNNVTDIITKSKQLACSADTWVLFDCPAHLDITDYPLTTNDIVIELVNCDAVCHSLIHKRLISLKDLDTHWSHYFLTNKYNSASTLEFDLYSLWQATMPSMAPFFINLDEVVKESTAYRNVTLNCAPLSIANDDFETLAGWLVSKAAFER